MTTSPIKRRRLTSFSMENILLTEDMGLRQSFQDTPLGHLPMELRQMIFKMLSPKELANCRLICRQLNNEIREDYMLMRIFWSSVPTQRCIKEALRQGREDPLNMEFFKGLTKFAPDPNPADVNGRTPLYAAAHAGHSELCRLILDRCEDKNPAVKGGWTPLHFLAKHGHLALCRLILRTVQDKNPSGNYGRTPLHWAANCGHLEVCQLILAICKDKNPADDRGLTPLHLAAWSGHKEVCKLILGQVEDKHPRDGQGKTPLDWAMNQNKSDVVDLINSFEKTSS